MVCQSANWRAWHSPHAAARSAPADRAKPPVSTGRSNAAETTKMFIGRRKRHPRNAASATSATAAAATVRRFMEAVDACRARHALTQVKLRSYIQSIT